MLYVRALVRALDDAKNYAQQGCAMQFSGITLKHHADKIAQKDTEPYHVVITWLRTQISFELLRSVHARERRFVAR